MVYRRKTRSNGKNGKVTRTYNTNGTNTYTSSTKSGGTNISRTQKSNGQYYITRTHRDASGLIKKERIYSSNPKSGPRSARKGEVTSPLVWLILLIMIIVSFIVGN